jgi:hypothetical protein
VDSSLLDLLRNQAFTRFDRWSMSDVAMVSLIENGMVFNLDGGTVQGFA